jgi:hypothetical protein
MERTGEIFETTPPPELQPEKPEAVFDKERARVKIDDEHDLVFLGNDEEPEPIAEISPDIDWKKMDLTIVDNLDNREIIKISDELHKIGPNYGIISPAKEIKGVSFFYEPKSYNVIISPEKLASDKRKIFNVFHEIGHALSVSTKEPEEMELIQKAHRLARMSQIDGNRVSPENAKLVIDEERSAWKNAIILARKIKKEHNIDLFKMFGSADEFMGWLRNEGLQSYEIGMGLKKTKTDMVKKFRSAERKRKIASFFKPILDSVEENIKSDFIEETYT